MVHTRINERSANPNPHINFISALPPPVAKYGATEDEGAKELLRALAAQLNPVMKTHGLTVNSFEEYESNRVFLGRNWNNGETVELVLRDAGGRFHPISRLLSVFCHELAHVKHFTRQLLTNKSRLGDIKHMNHSPTFHAFRRQLSAEVTALQRKGYYGDGYWSAGTRLSDSQRIPGDAWNSQELPEYTCGGAYSQSRHTALPSRRRQRARKPAGPSLSTGAQTAKQRRAGSRVTSKAAFKAAGEGSVLDAHVEKCGKGSGFRKKAGSRRAREERALAAERRLGQMQGQSLSESTRDDHQPDSQSEDEPDDTGSERAAPETDGERLKRMHDEMGDEDLGALRDDDDDIILLSTADVAFVDPSEMTGEASRKGKCSNQPQNHGPSASSLRVLPISGTNDLKRPPGRTISSTNAKRTSGPDEGSSTTKKRKTGGVQSDMLVQEIQLRKREALGMDSRPASKLGTQPTLDKSNQPSSSSWMCHLCTFANPTARTSCSMCEQPQKQRSEESKGAWACPACTYENASALEKCEICDKTRTS